MLHFGVRAGDSALEMFDFLGFTFYVSKNRQGKNTVKLQTSTKKLKAKRLNAKVWLRANMHLPVPLLIERLNLKLRGHYRYYGVTHNAKKMVDFYQYVKWQLLRVLRRRSQHDKTNWETFNALLAKTPVLSPKIYVNTCEFAPQ